MKRGQVNQKTGRGKKGRSKKAKHHNSRDNITPLEMIMVAKVKKEFTFIISVIEEKLLHTSCRATYLLKTYEQGLKIISLLLSLFFQHMVTSIILKRKRVDLPPSQIKANLLILKILPFTNMQYLTFINLFHILISFNLFDFISAFIKNSSFMS